MSKTSCSAGNLGLKGVDEGSFRCPHGLKIKSTDSGSSDHTMCAKCEREKEIKAKIAEIDLKMSEQQQALSEKEEELRNRKSFENDSEESNVDEAPAGKLLISLSMEEVTILMFCLKMPVKDSDIYDNLIDGNMLSVVEKIEDLAAMGIKLNPIKSKVLFYNILSFKTEGVPDRFLDRLAAASTPGGDGNHLYRLSIRDSDVGKLSDSQLAYFSGGLTESTMKKEKLTPSKINIADAASFLNSNYSTPVVSPRTSESTATTIECRSPSSIVLSTNGSAQTPHNDNPIKTVLFGAETPVGIAGQELENDFLDSADSKELQDTPSSSLNADLTMENVVKEIDVVLKSAADMKITSTVVDNEIVDNEVKTQSNAVDSLQLQLDSQLVNDTSVPVVSIDETTSVVNSPKVVLIEEEFSPVTLVNSLASVFSFESVETGAKKSESLISITDSNSSNNDIQAVVVDTNNSEYLSVISPRASDNLSKPPLTAAARVLPLVPKRSKDTNNIPSSSVALKKSFHNRRKSEASMAELGNSARDSPTLAMWTSTLTNAWSVIFSEATPSIMSITSSDHAIEALQILKDTPIANLSEGSVVNTLKDIHTLIGNNRDSLKGVIVNNGILLSVEVLALYKLQIEVVKVVLIVLQDMSTELAFQKLFGNMMTSELLMETLDTYGSNESVAQSISVIVQNMTTNDCKHNISLLDSDGICIILPEVLKLHKNNVKVSLEILKAINSITIYEHCMKFLGKLGLCETIVDVLKTHTVEVEVVSVICKIVKHMAVDESHELLLINLGIGQLLVNILKQQEENDLVCIDVLEAISNVSFNASNQAQLGSIGVCKVIIDALRLHTYKENLVEMVCGTIKNLSMNNENEKQFGREGACEVLTDLLRKHSQSEVLVTAICAAIKNITFDDENRIKFGASGACELLIDLACIHKNNERIKAAVKNLRVNAGNKKRFQALGLK